VPTPQELTCVNFQYGIGNSDGLSADDIFNEINNTLKTGLIVATRNVTIETLNTTLPRNESRRLLQAQQSSTKTNIHHLFSSSSSGSTLLVIDLGRFRHVDQDIAMGTGMARANGQLQKMQVRRRTAYLPSDRDILDDRRRLAFYTDEFPPTINSILDNPFCANFPEFQCAVVDSTVCVLLEEGDDRAMVRMVLLDGIEQAILDGSFQAAVPPENQLPGGEDIDTPT
jgi:hypothetical protein